MGASSCSRAPSGAFPQAQKTGNTHHIEIQAVDTDTGIVFNPQIDVFLDSKAKVPGVREVVFSQLVFSHLKRWLLVTILFLTGSRIKTPAHCYQTPNLFTSYRVFIPKILLPQLAPKSQQQRLNPKTNQLLHQLVLK